MTESEIHLMVLKHTNAMFTPPISRQKTTELNTAFWQKVSEIEKSMSSEDATLFKERVHFCMGEALDSWQQAVDDMPDNPPLATGRTVNRRTSSYLGRTVMRAVVWNFVNSLFRVFR